MLEVKMLDFELGAYVTVPPESVLEAVSEHEVNWLRILKPDGDSLAGITIGADMNGRAKFVRMDQLSEVEIDQFFDLLSRLTETWKQCALRRIKEGSGS